MDYIKVAKVEDVILYKKGFSINGSLHLTTHHLIFTLPPPSEDEPSKGSRELWLCYPMIEKVEFKLGSSLLCLQENGLSNSTSFTDENKSEVKLYDGANIRIKCRDFTYLAFDFPNVKQCNDVFESMMKLTCLNVIEKVYAFIYTPLKIELPYDGWKMYNPIDEFKRQGIINWRITNINENYRFCESYPGLLLIPSTISDNVLKHAAKFRSKNRVPVLTYYYKKNGCSITRCAQPLVGLKQSRSFQDEKLIQEIFRTNNNQSNKNLIVDARPLTNAMVQTALGAGTENMDNYKNYCKKVFLGIDNIHVMRESLAKVTDALKDGDISKTAQQNPNKEQLIKSEWLKHISTLLSGVDILIKTIHLNNNHLLIHCSDGWDRTSQLSSLVQLCIDPYFRTIDGFIVLVEKDWLSFGHRFNERCGFLQTETKFVNNSEYQPNSSNQAQQYINQVSNHFKARKHLKYTSPIFHQFLDCVYQLIRQYPDRFEFNERFLRRILYHLYSCQYGTFLYDSEYERKSVNLDQRTRSVWDYFKARQMDFTNQNFKRDNDNIDDVLYPKISNVEWWHQLFQISASINFPTATTFSLDSVRTKATPSKAESNDSTSNGDHGNTRNNNINDLTLQNLTHKAGELEESSSQTGANSKEEEEKGEEENEKLDDEQNKDDNQEILKEASVIEGITDENGNVIMNKLQIEELVKEAASKLSL
ncbi:hypothetical protein PACTADRAFT_50703 [Pachysolen tannophilus NRRL Y-2460]|uniref:Myotubularin phosphatase domain-containing protein n=1 Tax=Pachysolen tannophilus NRRL Y-2460 TaxID=669874 RepID=A0A1E4TSY6_PACTA|nr:hypothetical protein PACTADRAFT_50703 [Pachysolen tannophilus NRRL Y-2460]